MSDQKSSFVDRLYDKWLPSFCEAPHRKLSIDGFKYSSTENLDSFDAEWFLRAVDIGLVTESGGFFVAPQSKAKEQIFWTGRKAINPQPLTLWIEPIITVGAIARHYEQYGWPMNNLVMQSETWAFDLVCYDNLLNHELLVCEVKKSNKEI